ALSSMVSSSRYAATAPCDCCASRPVSNRTVRLPYLPLSSTAAANLISGPSLGLLLFVQLRARAPCGRAGVRGRRSEQEGRDTDIENSIQCRLSVLANSRNTPTSPVCDPHGRFGMPPPVTSFEPACSVAALCAGYRGILAPDQPPIAYQRAPATSTM